MIPEHLKKKLEKQKGQIIRQDKNACLQSLKELGVSENTEFGDFFMNYLGLISSPKPISELLDINYPTSEILETTQYVISELDIPDNFIALTSTEGEGVILYDRNTQAVFDIGFEDIDALIEGNCTPRWGSFFEFLEYYLSEE